MRMKRKDGEETRANLLDAAARIFAEKGFRAATISEICKMAGSNVASVNYHFESKEELYIRAWHRSFEVSVAKYPHRWRCSPERPNQGAPSRAHSGGSEALR